MEFFHYLSAEDRKTIFYKEPEPFDKQTPREALAYCLGATLYMVGTRESIAEELISEKIAGLTSTVFCLEDGIGDSEVHFAEKNLTSQIRKIHLAIRARGSAAVNLPLIFIRVREPEQISRLMDSIGDSAEIITGFVFPKFTSESYRYLEIIQELNQLETAKGPFYGLPILESARVIYSESRIAELVKIKELLDAYQDYVLNIRIGATDFSGLYGIRRGPDLTIYDVMAIRDCLSDIVNIFGRSESGYVISGPVWEYFANVERVLKPQLRTSPFEACHATQGSDGKKIRSQLLNQYIDGLIREVLVDRANGMIGKTIIHPSHILPVQSLYVVEHEEYLDASSILENGHGKVGVMKSDYTNKMNEIKPHYSWARRIMSRAKIYGVFYEQHNFISLLTESI